MNEESKTAALPEKLRYAIENVVRIANEEKFVIIGMVLRNDPPTIAVLRNTKDDAGELFHAAGNIWTERAQAGKIAEETILPLN